MYKRQATGSAWSRRKADFGHAKTLWSLNADADLWQRAFRVALSDPWVRSVDDPLKMFVAKRNAYATRGAAALKSDATAEQMRLQTAERFAREDAERIAAGTALCLPESPQVDEVGLRMEMWA